MGFHSAITHIFNGPHHVLVWFHGFYPLSDILYSLIIQINKYRNISVNVFVCKGCELLRISHYWAVLLVHVIVFNFVVSTGSVVDWGCYWSPYRTALDQIFLKGYRYRIEISNVCWDKFYKADDFSWVGFQNQSFRSHFWVLKFDFSSVLFLDQDNNFNLAGLIVLKG